MGELRFLKADMVLLQETHFTITNNKISSKDYPIWYYGDSPITRAKGVAIGFARGVRFDLDERLVDPEGRYLFLRGKLNGVESTLANIWPK